MEKKLFEHSGGKFQFVIFISARLQIDKMSQFFQFLKASSGSLSDNIKHS
jgi:hypothetical protein